MLLNDYSVALCTYNGENYIEEQLESILQQTVPPKEIIISDDGSKDRTLEKARTLLNKSGIRYNIVLNSGEHGVTSNFQNAISLCTQPYIFTSDQDDIWVRTKAETMLRVFEKEKQALLVFSDGELVDADLKPLHCSMWESVGITSQMLQENHWFEYMLNRCFVTGAAMAFKKELFCVDEVIPSCWLHDGWLAWKAVAQNGLVPCPEKLILYRQHGNNVVGMSSETSVRRIKSYIKNFSKMRDTHTLRYNRYAALETAMGDNFSHREQQELSACIHFWKDLVEADRVPQKTKRIKIVWNHFENGDFKKYFNGMKGAIRECLLIMYS